MTRLIPVVAAALIAFGFVFVHPFEDGNGRIHRFLVHNMLARAWASVPEGLILPVSGSGLCADMPAYDAALESFSKPIMSLIDWTFDEEERSVQCQRRYWRLLSLLRRDPVGGIPLRPGSRACTRILAEELDFLGCFDRAYRGVRRVVDMPNKKVSLFVRMAMQNGGTLPKGRRKMFEELNDDEVARMEEAVRRARLPEEEGEEA